MKPHLLVMLLLAIPPLIGSILACENAAKSDQPAPAKSESVAKDAATPAPGTSSAAPATAAPARSGTSHPTPSLVRAWDIM